MNFQPIDNHTIYDITGWLFWEERDSGQTTKRGPPMGRTVGLPSAQTWRNELADAW
jgi:hypothetical protein